MSGVVYSGHSRLRESSMLESSSVLAGYRASTVGVVTYAHTVDGRLRARGVWHSLENALKKKTSDINLDQV